jgi:septum formation protein
VSVRLVLASGSPRRAEILAMLGIAHEVRSSEVDERLLPGELPAVAARRLAEEKATAAGADARGPVLAADTIVALGDEALGKPADAAEAEAMLARLSGREHEVFTGLALLRDGRMASGVERTRVRFRSLAPREPAEYVATDEALDKAGAYGIQGRGAALVERIEGDYFNVVGLPVRLLLSLLDRQGLRYDFAGLEVASDDAGAGR